MADKAAVRFEPHTTHAKAFMSAVRDAVNKLQSDQLEWDKKVKRNEEDLNSRSSKLSEAEKNRKQQVVEFEQEKEKFEAAKRKLRCDQRNFDYQMSQREKHLKQQRDDLEAAQTQATSLFESDQVIQIHVGTHTFKTFCKTLRRFPESTLAQSANAIPLTKSDHPHTMFIDRDGLHFNFILNYLRSSMDEGQILDTVVRKYNLDTIADILVEASYYNLKQLVKILNWAKLRHDCVHETAYLISNGLFVSRDSSCITTKELPPGDVLDLGMLNFTGRRFEHVQFKHSTSFQGSVLKGAVFSKCKFEAVVDFIDTDLREAKFDDCEFLRPILLPGANTKDAVLPDNVRDYLEQL